MQQLFRRDALRNAGLRALAQPTSTARRQRGQVTDISTVPACRRAYSVNRSVSQNCTRALQHPTRGAARSIHVGALRAVMSQSLQAFAALLRDCRVCGKHSARHDTRQTHPARRRPRGRHAGGNLPPDYRGPGDRGAPRQRLTQPPPAGASDARKSASACSYCGWLCIKPLL
jgi:hypothetical protein